MKQTLPTIWDLSDLAQKHNDPKFFEERTLHEKKIKAFAKKWRKDQSYLINNQSLKKEIRRWCKKKSRT